jgi:DNA-damage-inducible protein D
MEDNKMVLFQEKSIRRVWYEEQWYYSIVDIIGILTISVAPQKYWTKLKKRLKDEGFFEYTTESSQLKSLKMQAADGKMYKTDAASRQTIFRIVMSVQSPNAEPFRVWLAQLGNERMEEVENPELAVERVRELYKAKGYPDEWIESRLKSIDIRKQLTDEWKGRGVEEGKEYAILTAQIAKNTFGVTPIEHKAIKGLERQNLRDHMTNMELIFSMLGEEATRMIAVKDDAQGFNENHDAAERGGGLAGDARRNFEEKEGLKVVSSQNFLHQIKDSEEPKNIENKENEQN